MSNPNEKMNSKFMDTHAGKTLLRGVFMIVIGLLIALAEILTWVIAVLQFFWLVFTKAPNDALQRFGASLGEWLRQAVLFQACESDDMPFPWNRWPSEVNY